jgi:hypothetical protein
MKEGRERGREEGTKRKRRQEGRGRKREREMCK